LVFYSFLFAFSFILLIKFGLFGGRVCVTESEGREEEGEEEGLRNLVIDSTAQHSLAQLHG
jgi:hypothetical protein